MKLLNKRSSSAILGAAVVSLAAVNLASAAVVFQADFNGIGGGTGGPSDVVALGGTGAIFGNNANFVSSIQGGTPVYAGNYLNTLWPATGTAGGSGYFSGFTPTSAASSLASFVGANIVNGPNTYVNLNGGFDIFARLNVKDVGNTGSGAGRSANWLSGFANITTISGSQGMSLAYSGLGYGAMRLEIHTGAAAGFTNYTKLAGPNGSNSFASGNAAFMDGPSDYFNDPNNYHLGFTFSTDANGLITTKLFARKDFGAIDTTSNADLQYAASFNLDAIALGANPISSGQWNQAGYVSPAGAGVSADYDTMRVYSDTAPASFAAVPEPASLGLLSLGGLALMRRRRRA